MKPPKRVMNALERVFEAEVDGRGLLQSKAQIYRVLVEARLLDRTERTFGTGWSAVTVSGYTLTHRGMYLYCTNCAVPDDDDSWHEKSPEAEASGHDR